MVSEGTPEQIKKDKKSLTGKYLSGELVVGESFRKKRSLDYSSEESFSIKEKKKAPEKVLVLKGASGRNLKKVNLKIPLGKFVCITGVSGSGKSTLIMDTLYAGL